MLHQPYRYKHKVAIAPIHNSRWENNKSFFEEQDKEENKRRAREANKFKSELRRLYPVSGALSYSKKQIRRITKSFPTKAQRKAARRHFSRIRNIASGRSSGGKLGAKFVAKPRRRIKYTYQEYIASPLWAERKSRYYRDHPRMCAACLSTEHVHLHHMVYVAYNGQELDKHLVPLCDKHHRGYHERYGTQRSMLKTTRAYIQEIREIGAA